MNWVLDADIQAFFDSISHDWMMRFLEHRVGDRRVLRLIAKWLKAGVMEEGALTESTEGTPQGAVISPLLGNIYLQLVLRPLGGPVAQARGDRRGQCHPLRRRHYRRLSYSSSRNDTYVYFTNRDADGLIDAVVYGRVLYGQGGGHQRGR